VDHATIFVVSGWLNCWNLIQKSIHNLINFLGFKMMEIWLS